jgi:hypothetical protein
VKSFIVFKAERPAAESASPALYQPPPWQRVGACRSRADAAQLAALLLMDPAMLGVWVREAEAGPAEGDPEGTPPPDAGAPDA